MNNAAFANYDPLSRKIVYSNDCDIGFPCQVVWKDYEKGFWCATVISTGENGVKTHTPQQLTEDYCEVKCMNEIEKAIMSGQIVLLKD